MRAGRGSLRRRSPRMMHAAQPHAVLPPDGRVLEDKLGARDGRLRMQLGSFDAPPRPALAGLALPGLAFASLALKALARMLVAGAALALASLALSLLCGARTLVALAALALLLRALGLFGRA